MPDQTEISALFERALDPHQRLALSRAGSLAQAMGMGVALVGGGVRDLLEGWPLTDLDIVIEGDAPALARTLATRHGGEVLVHGSFGTAKWQTTADDGGLEIDLATARTERYPSPAALPHVSPSDLTADLRRRDFTINAMALDLRPGAFGALLDPFGGRADLAARRLRVLHDGSFRDDPTRALRGARFASRFELALSPETAALLPDAREHGRALSVERLGAELDRLLGERRPVRALGLLQGWGLLALVHPSLRIDSERQAQLDAMLQRARALGDAAPADLLWIALGWWCSGERNPRLVPGDGHRQALLTQSPERVAAALTALASAARRSEAGAALKPLTEIEWIFAGAWADVERALELAAWWAHTGHRIRPAFGGRELIRAGLRPGPGLGDALRRAQRAAWDGADADAQMAAALSGA